jgi:hypothetical protein
MWKCQKCGEEIEDQFESCWKCAGPSDPIGRPIFLRADLEPPGKTRFLMFAITWFCALMITAPFAIMALPFFPLGLFYFLQGLFNSSSESVTIGLIVLGWLLYVIDAVFLFRVSKRTFYYIAYAILVVMLLTNAIGCHAMLGRIGE